MPTTEQIEAGAKALFEKSIAFSTGCYHWPGDRPRPILDMDRREQGLVETVSIDHETAYKGGIVAENLRAQARLVLEAAEAVSCGAS